MHEHSIEPVTLSAHRLRDAVRGEVIAPDDRGYDDARAVYYGIARWLFLRDAGWGAWSV